MRPFLTDLATLICLIIGFLAFMVLAVGYSA
jgi:hypothetical protein